MIGNPTGQLVRTADGYDLVLTRTFKADIEDVWASVTESERSARWFGPWEGDAGPGKTIRVRMIQEEGAPWMDLRIDACDPPRRLALSATDEAGAWRLELLLSHDGGITELRFVHHLADAGGAGQIGPGWEYYLDLLVAARDGSPAKSFDDYYPAMKAYFEALV
ncbi:SRPBCC family protein [Dactylosporangium sp. CA-233914]|uniref:SRPBCC family protein n=1 Tax=Dactylosporangium sp. CA-233914 TaxID=3239934 RepID=UPI003D8B2E1D